MCLLNQSHHELHAERAFVPSMLATSLFEYAVAGDGGHSAEFLL